MKMLLLFDFIGQKLEMTYKNKSHYQTYFGVLMSVIILFLTVYNSLDSFQMLINKTFPQISISYETATEVRYFDKLPFLISVSSLLPGKIIKNFIPPSMDNSTWPRFNYYVIYQNNTSNKGNLTVKLKPCNVTMLNETIQKDEYLYKEDKYYWDNYLIYAQNSYCYEKNPDIYSSFNSQNNGRIPVLYIPPNIISEPYPFAVYTVNIS